MAQHRAAELATTAGDREPVKRAGVGAGAVSGVASAVVGLAVLAGWVDQADAPALVDVLVALGLAAAGAVGVLAPIVAARWARGKVTPVEAPAVELADGTVVPAELVAVPGLDVL